MAIDSLELARMYRMVREASLKSNVLSGFATANARLDRPLDPTLSAENMYGSRAEWVISSAVEGRYDINQPVESGARRYPSLGLIAAQSNPDTGMDLY